jgi:hypothetical protein
MNCIKDKELGTMSTIRLVSYYPLCSTNKGSKLAKSNPQFAPFYDGSIRPEPCLEQVMPGISSLCRRSKLAPILQKGDIVIYITKKGFYGTNRKHRRLVAILNVFKVVKNHQEAANWYQKSNYKIPKNCVIEGNSPLPYEKSVLSRRGAKKAAFEYHKRADEFKQYNICNAIFKNVEDPPPIYDEDLIKIYGRIPGTQQPCKTSREQLEQFLQITGKSIM